MPSRLADITMSASQREAFVSHVWQEGRLHARDGLPWRYVDDPYAVYLSEVMLQQTQVSRVISYWGRWMQEFPTLDSLAMAATSDVLDMWQGLGYNRRALALKRTAEICSRIWAGHLPDELDDLLALPGVGPATAGGILAFAYQKPAVYLETNVRAVFLDYFFPHEDEVSDRRIAPLVEQTCSHEDPRGWYYALLDVGAYLKQVKPNPTRRSASYNRQSAFEGSHRQKRAFVLREVLANPGIEIDAVRILLDEAEHAAGRDGVDAQEFDEIVSQLEADGFFAIDDGRLVP